MAVCGRERLAIKMWSGWPTYPQIFIKGTLVGGASDLKKTDYQQSNLMINLY